MKDNFGSKFHLHLYTAGNNIENKKVLKDLADAGLDEIRFHPDENNWHKIEWALSTSMDVGAEIPVLPDKYAEIMKFTKYLSEINAKFLNLNELEMCDTNSESLKLHHYSLKDISTVKGSH